MILKLNVAGGRNGNVRKSVLESNTMKLRRHLEVCVSLRFFCDEKVHEEEALEYDKIGIDDGKYTGESFGIR